LTGAKWSLAPLHLQVVHKEHAKFVVEGNSRRGKEGVKIYLRNLIRPAMEVSLETHFRKASSVECLHV
jgi:hypothetical protein